MPRGSDAHTVGVKVAVLSDTHAPRRWKSCPPAVAAHLRDADVILHAGDVCIPEVIAELAEFAPVHVVRGNNDVPELVANLLDFRLHSHILARTAA